MSIRTIRLRKSEKMENSSEFRFIENILIIIVFIAFIENYVSIYIFPALNFITARLYFVLGIWLTIELFWYNDKNYYTKIYFFLIITVFLSFLLNLASFTGLIYYYKLYIFPFTLLIWVYKLKSFKIFKLFVWMYILNVVLNFGWLFRINPLPNNYKNNWADFAIGTTGSMFFGYLSLVLLVFGFIYRRKLLSIIAGFCLIITSSFVLFGFTIPVLFIASKAKLRQYISVFALVMILILGFRIFLPGTYGDTVKRIEIIKNLKFPKLDLYYDMFNDFRKYPVHILFGFGPGERTSLASEQTDSKFYRNTVMYYSFNYAITGGSIMDKFYSGISSIFWEIGCLGIVLVGILLYKMLLTKSLTSKEKKLNLSVLVLFILWSLIVDPFRNSYLSILYFSLLGLLSVGIENFLVIETAEN